MNEPSTDTIPLPSDDEVDLDPPRPDEAQLMAEGVLATIVDDDGAVRPIQQTLLEATFEAMTGHRPELSSPTTTVDDFAEGMRYRNAMYRSRLVQQAILCALVVDPIPRSVVERIRHVSGRLGIDDGMLDTANQFADQQFELAAIDFDRNGYTADWDLERATPLHASRPLDVPWRDAPDDPALAARWEALEELPEGTLGLAVSRFYRARGFAYPGTPGSVSPLLAQHDWVHVLADYGATLDNELEVFAFIARANDDPRGFSFLAMVVSLFETGVLSSGGGLFTPDIGHLRRIGMPERVADAMLRGARCDGSVDFLAIDWFELADRPLGDLRDEFGITDKRAGLASPGPFDEGGMTATQYSWGTERAASRGEPYESWGATVEAPSPPLGD